MSGSNYATYVESNSKILCVKKSGSKQSSKKKYKKKSKRANELNNTYSSNHSMNLCRRSISGDCLIKKQSTHSV